MNGQIYGHEYGCDWEGKDFVFISCGARNLDRTFDYWGGLRFSVKEFETEMFHERIHDAVNDNNNRRKHESIVEYVQVCQAYILLGFVNAFFPYTAEIIYFGHICNIGDGDGLETSC